MEIVIQKFGGTSVANREKLEIVCKRIEEKIKDNKKVVVVVSAQGKTTDSLIATSKEYVKNNYPKEMDLLLSTGEIQTVALLTMLLKEKGFKVEGMTGKQAGIITDYNYMKAKIIDILKDNIKCKFNENDVIVVAGFQGTDKYGNITTLGRGGSDLSAVAIAASLNAKVCEIYTDVDGIYSGNPKEISNAKLLDNISYDEMLVAASSGAKVLHNRSVGIGKEYDIPIIVRNTNKSEGGTIVMKDIVKEEYGPKIVATQHDISKITIIGNGMLENENVITEIYNIAKELNITIQMLSTSEISISIIINKEGVEKFANEINDRLILNKA